MNGQVMLGSVPRKPRMRRLPRCMSTNLLPEYELQGLNVASRCPIAADAKIRKKKKKKSFNRVTFMPLRKHAAFLYAWP